MTYNMDTAAVMIIVLGIGFVMGAVANSNFTHVPITPDSTPTRITTFVDGSGTRPTSQIDAGFVHLNEPVFIMAGGRGPDGLDHGLKVDDQGRVFCAPPQ